MEQRVHRKIVIGTCSFLLSTSFSIFSFGTPGSGMPRSTRDIAQQMLSTRKGMLGCYPVLCNNVAWTNCRRRGLARASPTSPTAAHLLHPHPG
eukprot:2951009-Rhodomonas_salina.3